MKLNKIFFLFRFIFIFSLLLFFTSFLFKQPVTASSQWSHIGLQDRQVVSLVNDISNPNILYAGTDNGVYKTTNGGNTWEIKSSEGISSSIIQISNSNPNVLYATKGNLGIQKSTNAGNSWIEITNNLGPRSAILDIAIDPLDSDIVYLALYGQCAGIWKTLNGGMTWNSVSGGCDFYRIRIAPSNNNIVYAGSLNLSNYFMRSEDRGSSWTNSGNLGLDSVGAVRGIAIDYNNPDIIFAGTEINGVFKTTNRGSTWTLLSNSPLIPIASAIEKSPTNSDIYARSQDGVSKSEDGGISWIPIGSNNSPSPEAISRLIIFINNPNKLYVTTSSGVYVYMINQEENSNLPVPYFNQNDLPWGPMEYDNSVRLGFQDPRIDRWGCAITSATMILKFHNINNLSDGTLINPGSLNTWLKNNNGYLIGKGSEGAYSYFNWPVIGALSNRLFSMGHSNVKLMHKRAYPNTNPISIIDQDLNHFPDIIKVNNSQTSNHFVVVKGKTGNVYSINDPEWNYPTLSSFDNYTQIDRYVPSQTDLSYIIAVINDGIHFLIKDQNNKKTGKYYTNNSIQTLSEIENASYEFQLGISNPNSQNEKEELGIGINELLLSEPTEGEYKITLSTNKEQIYEINVGTFQLNGENKIDKVKGVISKNHDEVIKINYSKNSESLTEKQITSNDLILDLNELKNLNQIKNNGFYNSLLIKANFFQLVEFLDRKTSINILKSFNNELSAQKGKNITNDAYDILLQNILSLQGLP